jgi:hypothetical protein
LEVNETKSAESVEWTSPPAIGAGFLIMPPEQWQTYLRYDTTISREFFKTLDALTRLQRARQTKKPATPLVPEPTPGLALAAGKLPVGSCSLTADSSSLTATSQLSDSGIRSVSQPVAKPAPIRPNITAAVLISLLFLVLILPSGVGGGAAFQAAMTTLKPAFLLGSLPSSDRLTRDLPDHRL